MLDLDETLIHSFHDGVLRQTVKPGTPADFIFRVTIDRHPVRFFVHKRPHVDFFLEVVSEPTAGGGRGGGPRAGGSPVSQLPRQVWNPDSGSVGSVLGVRVRLLVR